MGISEVFAIGISLVSFIISLLSFFWQRKHDQNQSTLEAINRLQIQVFDKLNNYAPDEIATYCSNRKCEEYKKLSGYVSRINHFAIGIKHKIYNRKLFYSLTTGYFDGDQITSRIIPIIENKNLHNNGKIKYYGDTLELIEWMKKRSKKNR